MLWTQEEARKLMTKVMEYTDILITTKEDTERVFGIAGGDYEEVAQHLADEFELRAVAITLRETESVWRNRWSGMVYAAGNVLYGPTFDIEVVDRVGAGDSFAGGFSMGGSRMVLKRLSGME